jgi:hypothetical protein
MIKDVMVWLDGGVSDEVRLAAVADIARRLQPKVRRGRKSGDLVAVGRLLRRFRRHTPIAPPRDVKLQLIRASQGSMRIPGTESCTSYPSRTADEAAATAASKAASLVR